MKGLVLWWGLVDGTYPTRAAIALKVIPSHRHRAVGKEAGQTNHIERLNNTFRQRISGLMGSSLSFSKKLDNHVGAIWYFIHHYNSKLTMH